MFNQNQKDNLCSPFSRKILRRQSLEKLLPKKVIQQEKILLPHKNFMLNKQNLFIAVPIKQYSNKFLRQKKKQDQQFSCKKKESFPNTHLQRNRKLISEFRKYNCRNQKFKKSPPNKENQDFIIYNLLFQKEQLHAPFQNCQNKTIFGAFTDNLFSKITQCPTEQNSFLEKGWKTVKNEISFEAKKQFYQKICQKDKNLIPECRKKCKTLTDTLNYQTPDQHKRLQKISTSRALEKYSKIIKVNPEHAKIQKMRVKKQLAKSIRLQCSQKSQFQAKQIIFSKKKTLMKPKSSFIVQEGQNSKTYLSMDDCNSNLQKTDNITITPEKINSGKANFSLATSKVGMFTQGIKFKKFKKFSQQINKCVTEEKVQNDDNFQDFEIKGWDINF